MKNNCLTKLISLLVIIGILAAGCASSTVLHTNPTNASVYVKGEKLGNTPYTYKDRKIAGASTLITFRKDGYEDYSTTLRKTEKWNFLAIFPGFFFIAPIFWCLGYDGNHTYDMEKAEVITQPVSETEIAQLEILEQTDRVVKPTEEEVIPHSDRVENLLKQGKIDKAVEYAEKQEGDYRSDCFFTLGDHYMNQGDYSAAEELYKKSGIVKKGNLRIAESLMRGEVVDSVVVVDEKKIKTYLGKVYDNQEDILSKMANSYEKYARENTDRIALAKKMKDMGMIAMSSGGKTININETLAISRLQAIFYLNSAFNAYEELGNTEKTAAIKNEVEVLYKDLTGELSTQNDTPAENILLAEDDRMIVTVDSIVRTKTRPQNITIALEETQTSLNKRPRRNEDYVLVYFNTEEKTKLNITERESFTPSRLIDMDGKNYSGFLERGPSYIRTDGGGMLLFNPAGPHKNGIIINERYILFIMPVNAVPVRLNYTYNYKTDKNARKVNTNYISIDLN